MGARTYSRDKVLALSVVVLAVFFGITGAATRLYHDQQASMSQQWYQRGNAELAQGHAAAAVEDFDNAVVYSRDNELFELRLAEALVAAGRLDEAQSHLEELWERTPGSGIVSLDLARLAAGKADTAEAVRYYNNAIYGMWEGGGEQQQARRRDAEFELYRFLEDQGQKEQAEAELMAIAAALPADPALHTEVGELMLGNSDYAHALAEFRAALVPGLAQPDALRGAGKAALQLGDYAVAVPYLEEASRGTGSDAALSNVLATAQAALELDISDSHLGANERARRASRALATAEARAESCLPGERQSTDIATPTLQSLYEQAEKMQTHDSVPYLKRHPDEIAPLMDLVTKIETASEKVCGESPDAADRALLLIARRRGTSPV